MDKQIIEIIIIGIIAIGIFAMYLGQIELASVALGSIAGYLGKEVTVDDINVSKETDEFEAEA